jgi:hypothetical protein
MNSSSSSSSNSEDLNDDEERNDCLLEEDEGNACNKEGNAMSTKPYGDLAVEDFASIPVSRLPNFSDDEILVMRGIDNDPSTLAIIKKRLTTFFYCVGEIICDEDHEIAFDNIWATMSKLYPKSCLWRRKDKNKMVSIYTSFF